MNEHHKSRRRSRARATASSIALAIAGAFLTAAPAAAESPAPVSGRISDDSGAPLPGARVSIREQNIEVSTDRQGRYLLPPLPPGPVTLDIEYLGMPQASHTVMIEQGAASIGEITLDRFSDAHAIVIVGSLTDGAARALNQQRTADNTTNVVSADSIGRFPDANIAEALQRVPGIGVERDQGEGNFISLRGAPSEFTSITVDGVSLPSSSPDTRAVDLGALPSEVVTALEISKSLLPWQDADSIAGSVNLVTRSPFDNPRFQLRVNGGLGYNEMGATNDERLSFVASNVFGPQNQFGVTLSASYAQTDRRVDNIESIWALIERPEGDEILGVEEQEFKDYETRRERISFTGALEYRPTATDRFFLRSAYGRRIDDEFRNLLAIVYADGDLLPGATETTASWDGGRFGREFRHRIKQDESWTLSAGGEHQFNVLSVDYALSFARSEETYPSRRQLLYRSGADYDLSYDFSTDPNNPTLSLFSTQEHLNAANFGFREHVDRWQDTMQDEVAGAIHFTVPTTLLQQSAEWRFGARVRQREVTADEERYRDRSGAASPGAFADLLSGERSQNFGYHLGWKYNDGLVRNYFGSQRPSTVSPGNRLLEDSTVGDYAVNEDVYAAYGAVRVQMERANLTLGLRVENTQFEGSAYAYDLDVDGPAGITRNEISHEYTDWFPNLTLRYAFSENLIARAALSRGIARPRYRDAVPRVSFEENDDGSFEVDRGNPDLQPTLSNNFDAGLEYYFEPLGVVSGGVFYKDLTDYVFMLETTGTYNGAPANFTQSQNAKEGHIYGIEFNYQQQFTFLPGWLSGFGVAANYTWSEAELTLPFSVAGRGTSAPLPNHSETTVNFSVFYETEKFNARLSWTDRGDFIDEFNEDPRLDTYWEGRSQLDFTASYDFTETVNVYFEAKNLTNSEGVRYAGSRSRVTEREQFGYLLFGGVRLNF
ncbi:MAG TPA: TonB-dependent receptor [Terricaulis sp.]|nr:TonB-dependent receptor [Terricaulis sp.]